MTEPKIYVASLSDWNDGNDYGKWFEFTDYTDGETLLEAIGDFLKSVKDEHGGPEREEYIVPDSEGFPKAYYSESMGQSSFNDVYTFLEMVDSSGVPAEAIEAYIGAGHDMDDVQEAYQGEYKDDADFAYQTVQQLGGISGISDAQTYVMVYDTDRRIMANEEADNYIGNIRDEDEGERLIKEGGLDVEDFQKARKKAKEEMLKEAESTLHDEIYNKWYDGLADPVDFLVNDQGIYSVDGLLKTSFIVFDYDAFARDLMINDYFSEPNTEEGGIYVFRRL